MVESFFSLVPVLREEYKSDGIRETSDYYHSVAVIKKGTLPNVFNMHDLRGAKACFPKVSTIKKQLFKWFDQNTSDILQKKLSLSHFFPGRKSGRMDSSHT